MKPSAFNALTCWSVPKMSTSIFLSSKKNVKNKYCVYEARRAIVEYAFNHLSINKIYGAMIFPDNESFMVNNMCIGFEIKYSIPSKRAIDPVSPLLNIVF